MQAPRRIVTLYRDAYAGLPREAWLLATVTFLHRSGTMVLPFLILYLTLERGFSVEKAGLYLALSGAGTVAGSWLGGLLTDRLGARPVQIASLVCAGVSLLALEEMRTEVAFAGVLMVFSTTNQAFRPANAVAMAALVPAAQRGRAFGLERLAINLGMSFGPAVGGFLALVDYRYLFWVDGATCLLAAGFLWWKVPAPPRSAPSSREPLARAPNPYRDGPFLAFLLVTIGLTTIFLQLMSTYPVTLKGLYGLPESSIGLLYALNTLLIVLFEMLLLHRLEGRPPLPWMALGTLLVGAGLALLPWGSTFAFAAFGLLLWSGGEMLTLPLANVVAADRAGERSPGQYLGLLATAFSVSFVLAPLAGPWVLQHYGDRVLWSSCGVLSVVLAGALLAMKPSFAGPTPPPPRP
jgi:predicted MFS family arabinose efflux permease